MIIKYLLIYSYNYDEINVSNSIYYDNSSDIIEDINKDINNKSNQL